MKNSSSVNELGSIIARFVHRHHIILYAMTIVIGVSVAVFFLNDLISLSNATDSTAPSRTRFDEATIKRIERLNIVNVEEVDDFSLPAGRVNPFVE